jgi:L-threonylcarbamoyladenylate synthase
MAGGAPSVTVREVQELFQDRIDLIIDGGPAANKQPSTIVDVTGERAILLRKGAVSCTALEDVLGYRPQSGRAAT